MREISEAMKPCPFCGSDAELDTSQSYRALSGGSLGSRAVVYCTNCGADMGFCYEDAPGTPREDIVNHVVDEWNRRPALAADAKGAGPVVKPAREFINELGNRIKITIEGPTSISENILTPKEFEELRSAIVDPPAALGAGSAPEWTREDLAVGLAALDGIVLRRIKSAVGPADDANNWREYLGRADDLMAHLSAAPGEAP